VGRLTTFEDMIGVEINGYQWASIGVNGHQLALMGGIK
jgi:hypothetical protein